LGVAGPPDVVEPVIIADAGPAGESHRAGMCEVRTIARKIPGYRNHVAFLERVTGPAMLHQRVRAAQFELPSNAFPARFDHVQEEVGMRVQPLDLRYGPFEIP